MNGVVAQTDRGWFDFLSSHSLAGWTDEVNFWRPRSQHPFGQLTPGEPFFLRLKSPVNAIAGFGFFAVWHLLNLPMAWDVFREKNGAASYEDLVDLLLPFRGERDNLVGAGASPLSCVILRDVHFFSPSQWIRWGEEEGWSPQIVANKRYDLSEPPGDKLMILLRGLERAVAPEFASEFRLITLDEREKRQASVVNREGQGTFRLRLLSAYGQRCAMTGERTVPVLEASHIQRYLGPASNHIQNGLLLRADLHELYDLGYLTVTRDLRIEVSRRIREEFENGRDYYALHGRDLASLPTQVRDQPSREALQWHCESKFLG